MHTASRKKDKTKHSVSSVLYSYPTAAPRAPHYTQATAQNYLATTTKKETPRDVLAYDEKVTGDFFDQEDHSVEDRDIYNTLGRKESKKEST